MWQSELFKFSFICSYLLNGFFVVGISRAPTILHGSPLNNSREIMRYAKAAEILNYMDRRVDPCQDFYKYACGNWARINPASKKSKTGVFNVLAEAYDHKLARLLSSAKSSSESDMERKVKYFYDSCMKRDEVRRDYRENLLAVMEEFGGMPALKGKDWKADEFDWLEVIAKILRKFGLKIIIGANISADLSNNQVNRLYLGQPDDLVTNQAPGYYARLKILLEVEMRRELGMNSDLAVETAKSVVDFEKSLAKGISDPLDGLAFQDNCRKRSLEDLSKTYQPSINFTRYAFTWLGYDYRLPVYEYVESYQVNLKKVIESTPKSVVANYIMWHLLQDFRLEIQDTHKAQKSQCVEVTKRFFVKFLDNMVYRELLGQNENLTDAVYQIWEELKEIFRETLHDRTSTWMGEATRKKAIEKLQAMKLEINSYESEDFSNEFGDLVISTENFFGNVKNILHQRGKNFREKLLKSPKLDNDEILNFTPAYAPEFNKILIPVAFLQPRYLWDPIYPAALKYATAGYIVAHEMAHGFDYNVREYDAMGNLNNWWDAKSSEEFLKRKECLSQHYSEYKFAGQQMPRSNAQDENIADNVGIHVAFAAYDKWLSRQLNADVWREEIFLTLDLKPHQLFFVGLAQIWCTDIHKLIRPYLARVDVHPPEEIRVAAMMSNSDAFALEFQCKFGSRMNPQRKCVMY